MPLKILFLSHKFFPDIGGIESISEMLALAFSEAGHEVRLLTWSEDPSNTHFPFGVIRNPGKRSLFREHRWADIVFENNPCFRMAWPGFFLRKPSVIALQTWTTATGRGIQEKLKARWLKRAAKVISCSEAIRRICWPSSVVIGNPYQAGLFRDVKELSQKSGFIFLGRLVSDKGADIVVKAFRSLAASRAQINEKLQLTIVGDGPEKPVLEQMVRDFGLTEQVVFTGALRGPQLVECLNRHRYLLVPSRWEEPFGIVALEGMACGCLPIVSDGGGLPDAVGEAGLTFRRGDADDLVMRMQQLLEDPALETRLRKAAPNHLSAHSAAEVANKYLSIIAKAV
ncbi:MAG: glycosyltransferase family 4 protein [Chitinophagaceae bacterium]